MNTIFQLLLLSFISWLLYFFAIPLLIKTILDHPNERSSHSITTPTSGGIIIVLVNTLYSIFTNSYLGLIVLPLAIVGVLDDWRDSRQWIRFTVQFFVSNILVFNGKYFSVFVEDNNFILNLFIWAILILVCMTIINFVNFMDGIDGLVASNMIFIFVILSFSGIDNLVGVIGATTGFLIWNWHPAKVFMGDVGSTYLAAIYAASLLNSDSIIHFSSLLIISFPLLGDALLTLLRRFFNGENIFTAHKKHLYQRLQQGGMNHAQVSIIYLLNTTILSAVSLFLPNSVLIATFSFVVFIGIILEKNYAIPFR